MAFITPTLPSQTNSCQTVSHSPTATTPLPPRVIPDPLPNLYLYDHCPFCIRVRHALGLKNVKHNLIYLANDDISTPTALVGKKLLPIFQPQGAAGPSLLESLDIIALIDSDPRFGAPGFLRPFSPRSDITAWISSVLQPLCRLTRPRFARAYWLPEFASRDGREALRKNYPLEDPSDYGENFRRSDEWIQQVADRLPELEGMIWSAECCTEGGVGYDDIVLFARVRSMTIIKGLVLPPKVRAYAEWQANRADVGLYDYCAM